MRKIFSAVIALTIAITSTTSVYAADVSIVSSLNEVGETINIGGYECYERDGQYWTIDDGEECLVIDIGDCEDYGTCVPASLNDDDIPLPYAGWTNSRVLYSPHNTVREDTADLRQGDYCSPIFRVFPVDGDHIFNVSYRLNFNFTSKTTINMTTYMYNNSGQSWHSEDETVVFNSGLRYCVLFVGTTHNTTGAFAVRFNKNGSDNLSTFNYTFQVKLPLI